MAEGSESQLLEAGRNLLRVQDFAGASDCFRRILERDPEAFEANWLLGACLLDSGQAGEALGWLDRSAQLRPDLPDVHVTRGTALRDLGHLPEAEMAYRQAIRLSSACRAAHMELAALLLEQERTDEARAEITLASTVPFLEQQPSILEVSRLTGLLCALRLYEPAAAYLRRVTDLQPDSADAWMLLAGVLVEAKDLIGAEDAAHRSLALKNSPGGVDILCSVFSEQGREDEAIDRLEKEMADFIADVLAETAEPPADWLSGLTTLAYAKGKQRDLAGAMAIYRVLEKWRPDHPTIIFNHGLLLLASGDFEEGWPRYEWRWRERRNAAPQISSSKPLWLGKVDPVGKTLLIHCEQGLGDTIQFLRYVFLVVAIGGTVILVVQEPLVGIVKAMGMPVRVIHSGAPLPDHDLYCPLLSLPLAFETRLDTIPAIPEYIYADAGRVQAWRARIGPQRALRVGLAWSGNPRHLGDDQRSVGLHALRGLADVADVEFFCLQKEVSRGDLSLARDLDIRCFGSNLTDFQATAALIGTMDLVIAVDTAIAHLAGAMGKPVWILIGFPSDWRWLMGRTGSPWYPSARLYRKEQKGDWSGVIADVAHDLAILAQSHVLPHPPGLSADGVAET